MKLRVNPIYIGIGIAFIALEKFIHSPVEDWIQCNKCESDAKAVLREKDHLLVIYVLNKLFLF